MPLNLQVTLQVFDNWEVDFIRPVKPPTRRTRAMYIITVAYYLIIWEKAQPITKCSMEIVSQFLFENIVTSFGCPKVLLSDHGTHFLNNTISSLT
jgi:hypothetical protein